MPTRFRQLGLSGRGDWVASIFAAVDISESEIKGALDLPYFDQNCRNGPDHFFRFPCIKCIGLW